MFKKMVSQTSGDLKKHGSLLILYIVFICGAVLGAWAVSLGKSDSIGVAELFENYYSYRSNAGFVPLLGWSLLVNLSLLAVCYFLGMCALGTFFSFAIPLLRGFGVGLVSGFLYNAHSLAGIGFFALIMLPGLFVSSFALLFACRESLRFSVLMFRTLLPVQPISLNDSFRIYSIKFGIFAIFMLLASVCDAVMSSAFIGFFNF